MTSPMRTVSPSTGPRSASGGATDFLPASALLDHQQALRPAGEEDARCARSTSATQSNCVHPHLVCSRLLTPLSQRGCPTESKAPCGSSGDRTFHDVRDRFGGSSSGAASSCSFWSHERGRFLPTAPDATEPLTPLSRAAVHPRASPTFVGAATLPYVLAGRGCTGRRMRQTAETTVHAAS